MVHRREVNGEEVVFGNQGDLFERAMTWFDHDTGSVWSQPSGEAILGPLAGERLELLPSTLARWSDWRTEFPDTLALNAPAFDINVSLQGIVVVAALDGESVAVDWNDLQTAGQLETVLSGEPILVIADPESIRWAGYLTTVAGVERDLQLRDGFIVDVDSGERWDASLGNPVDGQGTPLERLPLFSSFRSDYQAHFPEGRLLEVGE